MRIQRSWVLCVLTIMALVIAVHEAEAQSYPYAVPISLAPAVPSQRRGGARTTPGGYASTGLPYGYQPRPHRTTIRPRVPLRRQLAPTPAAPMGDAMGPPMNGGQAHGDDGPSGCHACGGYGCEQCMGACDDFDLQSAALVASLRCRWMRCAALVRRVGRMGLACTRSKSASPRSSRPKAWPACRCSAPTNWASTTASGARVSFAIQLGAGNNIESTLLGGFNWASQAEAVSADNQLFSIMSQYGKPRSWASTTRIEAQSQRARILVGTQHRAK